MIAKNLEHILFNEDSSRQDQSGAVKEIASGRPLGPVE
jgi:hypothetical protein